MSLLAFSCLVLAFMFSMGCCCGNAPCTGSGTGDCCIAALPTSLDLTLPNDFADDGCTSCGSLGATYTLTATTASNHRSCGGFGAEPPPEVGYWSYYQASFCNFDTGSCGTQDMDLLVFVRMVCLGGTCTIRAYVYLRSQPPALCCCHYGWYYEATFDADTDCDTETWTLPYVAIQDNGCTGDTACFISGTPGDITITKT